MTSDKTTFTIHEIAKIMYRIGAPEHLIVLEICALSQLQDKILSYDELHMILRNASESSKADAERLLY